MTRDEITTTVREVLESMGFNVEDRLEMQRQMAAVRELTTMMSDENFKADLQHLRSWRLATEKAKTLSFSATLTMITAGILGALWLGIKELLK